MTGFTLDTGALIALERGSELVDGLIERTGALPGAIFNIPAGVVAQAYRNGSRQARLRRLLNNPQTRVVPLDARVALVVGVLLRVRGCSDVIDASVVVCARTYGQSVVTSDPRDLRRLDSDLTLEVVA